MNISRHAQRFRCLVPTSMRSAAYLRKTWNHIRICPLEIVHCEYHNVGCVDTIARKDQKEHNKLNAEKHLTLTTCDLSKAKEMIAITTKLDTIQSDTVGTREYIQQRFVKSDKEMIGVKQELDAATAATLETKGYFIQKLAHTDRELASVKQDLAVVKTDVIRTRNEVLQKLTRAERNMANLTKVATAQRDAMDKLAKQVKENSEKKNLISTLPIKPVMSQILMTATTEQIK